MTYQPAWNATFAKPLLNQVIALIQRDQAAAIGIVNAQLAPINNFCKGPESRTAFPWLMLTADSTVFDHGALGTRASTAHVAMALDVGQFDQEMAQDNAQDYARVLDMVVTSATLSDWEAPLPIVHCTVPAGTTTPPAAGSVKEVFVESHGYSSVTLKEIESPVLNVTVKVQFVLEET